MYHLLNFKFGFQQGLNKQGLLMKIKQLSESASQGRHRVTITPKQIVSKQNIGDDDIESNFQQFPDAHISVDN